MRPRAGGRHCARCDHVVVDLTDATRARAEAIARESGGRLCVRMRVDEDGEAVFREPPLVPLRRAAAGVAVAALMSACDPGIDAGAAAPPAAVAPLEPLRVDLGAPMLPIDRADVPARAVEPAPSSCVHEHDAGMAAPADADDGAPTAEQRARTRRKHRRSRGQPPPMLGLLL
jgi:hypothetical protein